MVKEAIKFLIKGFKYFPSPIFIMVAATTLASGIIGYNTFVKVESPVTLSISNVYAVTDDTVGKTALIYDCYTLADETASIKLNRRISCNDGLHYDLPDTYLTVSEGDATINRHLSLPYNHLTGTKCVFSSDYEWSPTLSIKPHTFSVGQASFTVDGV
jgi:hypothetical protein